MMNFIEVKFIRMKNSETSEDENSNFAVLVDEIPQ